MIGRVYWDSDCFIGWFEGEADKVEACQEVLDHAARGHVKIITSALTIAEAMALRGYPKVPSSKRSLVERFFKHKYIGTMTVTRRIGEHARDLVWDHSIKPKDAIHVASALATNVPILNTFDNKLITRVNSIGYTRLRAERPRVHQREMDL